MITLFDSLQKLGPGLLGGTFGALVLTAIARHIPDWPLSMAKLWGWFKDATQEIANQRNPTQPATPAKPQK